MKTKKDRFRLGYGAFVLLTYILVGLFVDSVGVEGDYYKRHTNYTAILTVCIHVILASIYFIYNICKIFLGKYEDEDEDELNR